MTRVQLALLPLLLASLGERVLDAGKNTIQPEAREQGLRPATARSGGSLRMCARVH